MGLNIIILVLFFAQLFIISKQHFKISYYEQKLVNRNIDDGVRSMSWWKLWIN
jgi:hypothetical protein